MDGWMDARCVSKGGRGGGGGRSLCRNRQHLGKTHSYVVWLLGLLVAGLVGQFVGWHSVGGCMDHF